MPIPKPEKNEENNKFVARCMGDKTMKKDYPDNKQRVAVCLGQTKGSLIDYVIGFLNWTKGCEDCLDSYYEDHQEEILSCENLMVPNDDDYEDFNEEIEDFDIAELGCSKSQYKYMDPNTREIYYFERKGNYKKDGKYLRFEGEAKAAEYQGRKVKLNKPFRTPDAKKKFAVYVRNKQGKVIIVRFGSQEMSIKRDDPARRKSFRARHKCDQQKDKTTPAYWSCWQWRANSPVQG